MSRRTRFGSTAKARPSLSLLLIALLAIGATVTPRSAGALSTTPPECPPCTEGTTRQPEDCDGCPARCPECADRPCDTVAIRQVLERARRDPNAFTELIAALEPCGLARKRVRQLPQDLEGDVLEHLDGEDTYEDVVDRAIREYDRHGRFPETRRALEALLAADGLRRVPVDLKEEALTYLAKALLALDEEELATQRVQELLSLLPEYLPDRDEPARFKALVRETRRAGPLIATSASKMPEDPREAPATVLVIEAEEIARRGYLDLEQLLHDLPGFDISRGNGVVYSNLYLRGYRAVSNDRILYLLDGVEENDLWSNTAFISRQYPLSAIKRVEIVYGPASTIYGPNAFLGVVNVITKSPNELLLGDGESVRETGGEEEPRSGWETAIHAELGGGTWNTKFADATIAAGPRGRDEIAFSITTRLYSSDEMDLSGFTDWDFDPGFYDAFPYPTRLDVGDPADAAALWGTLTPEEQTRVRNSTLVDVEEAGSGQVIGLSLSEDGAAAAAARDRAGLTEFRLNGQPVRFSDGTEDWSIYARLRLFDIELGAMTWRRDEGSAPWYVDRARAGADNGNWWIPEQTFLYLKYDKDISPITGFTLFARYKDHKIDSRSGNTQVWNYQNGRLDILDLALESPPFWQDTRFVHSSRQLRTELTVVHRPSDKLNIVAGLELRFGTLQGDYQLTTEFLGAEPLREDTAEAVRIRTRNDTARQFTDQFDIGAYAQASYRPTQRWKLVVGGRVDSNSVDPIGDFDNPETPEIERPDGYGTVFNPRLAAIHLRGPWIFKAIYAEAFKDASNFNRYATAPGVRELQNPALEPEEVQNLELSAAWEKRTEKPDGSAGRIGWNVALYRAEFTGAVAQLPAPSLDTNQNQNAGSREISGLQSNLDWTQGRYDLFANYTYTDPRGSVLDTSGGQNAAIGDLRIRDIARHQINLGGNARLRERWNLNARLNYVGERGRGVRTTAILSPLPDLDSYLVAHAAVTYKESRGRFDIQLVFNNLFDEAYFDPGIRTATGQLASQIPQNERAIFLRTVVRF